MCSLGPPPAPSRSLHKYYDSDDVVSDYSQELFEAEQRRSYRSADSPLSHGCRNGRYASPGPHDDVFCESKSQPDWDSNSRTGYKSSDDRDRTSSRGGQHGHSPSDSDRSRVSRSRTSQSISPVRRRHSKDHKVISPTTSSSRDHSRRDDRSGRHNSLESSDRDRYSSSSRALDSSRSWTHGSGGDSGLKLRTVANDIDGDSGVGSVTDRDRLLRSSDGSHRGVTVTSDTNRRHGDKEVSRSHVLRSVVNTTPSWRFDTEYKHSLRASDRSTESFAVDTNHVGVSSLQKLRPETIEVASDSTSPRSKSPHGCSDVEDVEISGTHPDRPPSKGSDDMSHLEKEKSHLLNMLKELEDYSSGGSEMEGLDEESRAALRRLHRQRDDTGGDNDSSAATAAGAHDPGGDVSKSSNVGKSDTTVARRLSETSRQSTDTKRRRVSLENHVGSVMTSSLDAEDNIIDLIGTSPPAEIPAEFTRRQRAFSDVTTAAADDRGVKHSRRSYRPRESADSAESGTEDAGKTQQSADHRGGCTGQPEDAAVKSSSTPAVVHRTHSLEDVNSSGRRVSLCGPSRKGSAGDHQPCIIPDSPVTTRGPDIRPPTEPRTVSLTVTAGGRTIMDLPLPRFGLERQRLRHSSASASSTCGEHATSTTSVAESNATTATGQVLVSSVVTLKTDIAPFSPGLLSPAAMSPPALKLDSSSVTLVSSSVSSSQSSSGKDKQLPSPVAAAAATAIADAVQKEDSSAAVKPLDEEVDKPVTSDEISSEVAAAAAAAAVSDDKKPDVTLETELDKPDIVSAGTDSAVAASALLVSGSTDGVKEETSTAISDTDVSDLLSPGSPSDSQSLEDRIRALDEKLSQMQKTTPRHLPPTDSTSLSSSAFDYSKFIRRRRQPTTPTGAESSATSEPSDYVKSLLSRTSIFDQDSWRLEQLHSKFDPTVSTSATSLIESSSSLVSRMRSSGRLPSHDLSLQLPPMSTPLSSTSSFRSADLPPLLLTSPVASYCSRTTSLVTPPPSGWGMSGMDTRWTSSWAGLPSPSPQLTDSTPTARPSNYLPYGMPQTPGQTPSSSAPTDPRRAPRSADMFPSPVTVRRPDSCHSSDTSSSDAWTVRREPEMSPAPSKPKEMVSPPMSILKKTSSSMLKDDVSCSNTKVTDSLQSSADTLSTGVKRSADTAFGRELPLSTPNKVLARTPKPVTQPSTTLDADSHSTASKGSESDQLKAPTNVLKRPEPVKKPVQSKPSVSKTDDKKTDHTSGSVTSSRKTTSEDAASSKSGCSVKPATKPHSSTTSMMSSSSSASNVSKSHSHKDTKPTNVDSSRHTVGPKESSSAENNSVEKHGWLHGIGKPKTSHTVSRESATKDRSGEERDKSTTSEEKDLSGKDKSTSHGSSKHHQSEHRHSDKTPRDGKPEDAGKTPKASVPSSTSKTVPKPASRDNTKPERQDKPVHSKTKPTEAGSCVKKDGLESGKKDSTAHARPLVANKADREHMMDKEESHHDRPSVSNMQAKPLKKHSLGDGGPSNRSSSSSSSKPSSTKHVDKNSSYRKNDTKKLEPSKPSDKLKKTAASSAGEKNKTVKKKKEKRPEEKREVMIYTTFID